MAHGDVYQGSVNAHDVVSSVAIVLHLHASNCEPKLHLLRALRLRFLLVGSKPACEMSHANMKEAYSNIIEYLYSGHDFSCASNLESSSSEFVS